MSPAPRAKIAAGVVPSRRNLWFAMCARGLSAVPECVAAPWPPTSTPSADAGARERDGLRR
eukprot:186290-Lingulodinium_polyedra.AAC.1